MIDKLKRRIFRDGFVVAIGSFLYGMQIFIHPHILENYKVYQIVNKIFDNHTIGFLFMIVALFKIIGTLLNIKIFREIGLLCLSFFWGVFFFSFLFTPPPNTVWTLSLTMCLILIQASAREDG